MGRRYLDLDVIRGVAIILMVIFHFCYDLGYFGYIEVDTHKGTFWVYFRDLIIFLFMISIGISLYIVNEKHYNLKKNSMRLLKIFAAAALISMVSYMMYPKYWIYFGIIHLIFVVSLLAQPIVRLPYIALFLGLITIASTFMGFASMTWLYELSKETLHLPKYTKDLAYLFPWLGVVFVGIYLGYKRWFILGLPHNRLTHATAFLGQHGLLIYLVHQPIMMGIFELFV